MARKFCILILLLIYISAINANSQRKFFLNASVLYLLLKREFLQYALITAHVKNVWTPLKIVPGAQTE